MVFRFEPKMTPDAYQTYELRRPTATHTRAATCAEVDCEAHLKGWRTLVDLSTPVGRKQANYIRLSSGRHFTAVEEAGRVTFTFPAGQRCFAEHRVPIDRPTIYLKRGGDWRATTFEPSRMRSADWVDDFANHQSHLADLVERG
jgi:hypothetical protein